jgi:hypothetical protein
MPWIRKSITATAGSVMVSLKSRINDRVTHENLGVLYLAFTFEVPTGQAALDSSLLPAFSSCTYRALRRARITMIVALLRGAPTFHPTRIVGKILTQSLWKASPEWMLDFKATSVLWLW